MSAYIKFVCSSWDLVVRCGICRFVGLYSSCGIDVKQEKMVTAVMTAMGTAVMTAMVAAIMTAMGTAVMTAMLAAVMTAMVTAITVAAGSDIIH